MSTPKEAADLIAKKCMGKAEGKVGSSSTPTRHSLRQNSAANSPQNSPAQGKGSTPTKQTKPSGKSGKSPPTKHKSPLKTSHSPTTNFQNPEKEEAEAAEIGGKDNDDDEDFPDYKGREVSYNDPASGRPGHGMVGD
jgi:hypothetical protein